MNRYLAIVNPAAGGGRCGKLAPRTLEQLRTGGVAIEVAETQRTGNATALAKEGYEQGFRHFLAVGGDGTSFEIVNGLFPRENQSGQGLIGISPLGDWQFLSPRLHQAWASARDRGHYQTRNQTV